MAYTVKDDYNLILKQLQEVAREKTTGYLNEHGYKSAKQTGTQQAYQNYRRALKLPKQIPSRPDIPHWQNWLETFFPNMVNGYGEHHINFWEYFETLKPKKRIDDRVIIWSRLLGKSSTVEMAVARAIAERRRMYIWYVCGVQAQAEKHVQTIADLLETKKIANYYPQIIRLVGKYGQSKSYNKKLKRFANGVALEAVWIMGTNRGAKILNQRPDLIVIDDIEDRDDTPKTTLTKENRLTGDILSAGSSDSVVWLAQNQITEHSIASSFVRGDNTFLHSAIIDKVSALNNFKVHDTTPPQPYEVIEIGKAKKYITGDPTSPHLSLKDCADVISKVGLIMFRIEYQHETDILMGDMFDKAQFNIVKYLPYHSNISYVRYWDKGATKDGGSFTCGVLMAKFKYGPGADQSQYYIVDLVRGQWEAGERDLTIYETAVKDWKELGSKVTIWIEQEPGGGGKDSANATLRRLITKKKDALGNVIIPGFKAGKDKVQTGKGLRAEPLQTQAKVGNIFVLDRDWTNSYINSLCRLQKANLSSVGTDELDATSGAFRKLM